MCKTRDFRDWFKLRASHQGKSRDSLKPKFFVLSVLATCLGDLNATWFSHEKHVFCANRSVFKTFLSFPLNFCDCSLSSLFLPLSNSPSHSQKTSICSSFQLQSSRKRYGFSYSHYIFHVLCLGFLDLWVFIVYCVTWGFGHGLVIFVEFEWMGFVDFAFKMLHFSVIMIEFQYWVCLLICNVLSMSYLLWSVFLPYVYFFGIFLWYTLIVSMVGSPCLFFFFFLHDWIMCLVVYPKWFLLSFCTHCHYVML